MGIQDRGNMMGFLELSRVRGKIGRVAQSSMTLIVSTAQAWRFRRSDHLSHFVKTPQSFRSGKYEFVRTTVELDLLSP